MIFLLVDCVTFLARTRPIMADKSQGQKMKINQNVKMSMSHQKKKDSTSSLPPLKYECLEEMRLQVTRAERRDIPVKDRYRWGQQKSITSLS